MSEKLCLQWNDFKDNIIGSLGSLRNTNDFADVTLVSEDGKQVDSHKLVLSSSSPVFQKMLKDNKHSHPLIFMRGLKSDDLLAILDFLYFGEANIYQENLDSFLRIAEELQLKGLMGNAEHKEETQKEAPAIDFPKISEPGFKQEREISKTIALQEVLEIPDKSFQMKRDISADTVAIPNDVSGDMERLDEQINSMMEKTLRKNAHGQPLYVCNVCGKEDKRNHIKLHIESNHLEGVSVPCNFCEKTFRSRRAIKNHKQTHHKEISLM